MKNSVLILGIALVSFSNISNAKNTINLSYDAFQNTILADNNAECQVDKAVKFEKPSLVENVEVFNPETVIANNPKTVKEIIAEGDKIVEAKVSDDKEFMEYEESMREIIAQSDLTIESNVSNETYPLFVERTIQDEIAELEMIIESTESNETRSLNLKKINSNSLLINTFSSKKIIGMN